MSAGENAIEFEGVRLTSPDRVLFGRQGITKLELARYHHAVADHMLPHLRGRPLTLVRCPQGAGTECFVQRKASESFPRAIRRVEIPGDDGAVTYAVVEDLAGVLSLVQLGVLELHTWSARRDRLDRPDRLILDLDPAPDLPFEAVVEAALELRDRLGELGLRSFVKTTGGKGLHLLAPLVRRAGWEEVREFARALAERLERERPDRYLATASKAAREGRIYVDYLRNGWSASAVAAYSPRAREGAPVSTPLRWDELERPFRPADLNVRTVPERLAALGEDPWSGYGALRQGITRAARRALGLRG